MPSGHQIEMMPLAVGPVIINRFRNLLPGLRRWSMQSLGARTAVKTIRLNGSHAKAPNRMNPSNPDRFIGQIFAEQLGFCDPVGRRPGGL